MFEVRYDDGDVMKVPCSAITLVCSRKKTCGATKSFEE